MEADVREHKAKMEKK
jgi:hypothetical protein